MEVPAFWPVNDWWAGVCFPSELVVGHLSELASLPYSMAKMVSPALKIMTSHKRADNVASLLVLRPPKHEQAGSELAPWVLVPSHTLWPALVRSPGGRGQFRPKEVG